MSESIPDMLARVAAECEADTTERPKWRHGRPRPLVIPMPTPTALDAAQFRAALNRARRHIFDGAS